MKHFLVLLLIFVSLSSTLDAQHRVNGRKKIDIPFQLENNFIIVNIRFNRVLPLKFVFDTGAEYTILTKREFADMIGIRYEKEFKIMGADLKTILTAYLARGINLEVGSVENPIQDFLVLGDDYFQFEALSGVEVHGILGANFFSRYVVKINYRKRILTLYDPQHFTPPKGFEEIPISVYKNKPYVKAPSKLYQQDSTSTIKLLIDTGASLTLLLYTDTHPALDVPEQIVRGNIGKGLGGDIEGFIGRFYEIRLGKQFVMKNIVANYQEIYEYMDTTEIHKRNGLIGNVILNRFDVIINYNQQKLYLKPNKAYKRDFRFDRSGLVFLASGANLNTYTVNFVVPGSPADEAGIKKGDRVKRVNWLPVGYMSLADLTRKLQGRAGKEIRMVIIRDKEKLKKRFKLRDII